MLGKVCILVISMNKPLFWKPWHLMIFGYGMHFFGLLGSHNDINVLEQSFVFTNLIEGCAPPVNYSLNGYDNMMGYYLADDIYPL
jgi:hypothetical protein